MLTIKRIADQRLNGRICSSFNVDNPEAFAYGAFDRDQVLGTAVFQTQGETVVLCGADTGRRLDVGLIDGMARAAFFAQMRAGAKNGQVGDVSDEVRLALTKLGYDAVAPFPLASFFAKKNCGR